MDNEKKVDEINHPSHYNSGKIETIEMVCEISRGYENDVDICIGNVVKYLSRAPYKGTLTNDLKKAQWYLAEALRRIEENG